MTVALPVSLDDVAVRRKVQALLGLGVRGRLVVVGAERVRIEAQRDAVRLAFVAPDASRHSLDKVVPVLRARGVAMVEWPGASELGAAVGREATAAVGIVDPALAEGIRGAMAGTVPGGDTTRGTR